MNKDLHDEYCDGIEEVAETIRERGKDYGSPLSNHQDIASLWSLILATDVTPLDVVKCMIAVKLARLHKTEEHDDSWCDLIGYAGIGRTISKIQKRLRND